MLRCSTRPESSERASITPRQCHGGSSACGPQSGTRRKKSRGGAHRSGRTALGGLGSEGHPSRGYGCRPCPIICASTCHPATKHVDGSASGIRYPARGTAADITWGAMALPWFGQPSTQRPMSAVRWPWLVGAHVHPSRFPSCSTVACSSSRPRTGALCESCGLPLEMASRTWARRFCA